MWVEGACGQSVRTRLRSSGSGLKISSIGASNTADNRMAIFSIGSYRPFSSETIVYRDTLIRSARSAWLQRRSARSTGRRLAIILHHRRRNSHRGASERPCAAPARGRCRRLISCRSCSTPSTWTGRWSPPTRCAPRWTQPGGSPGVVVTTPSPSRTTRRPCTVLSRPCPGRASHHPSPGSTPDTGGGYDALSRPSRPSRPLPGWTSPQPPRCSRSDAPGPSRTGSTLRWSTRVCSLPMTDAQPEAVAAWTQGHWGTENRLHRVRDVIFDEDRHQLRTANGPQVMATLRNLATRPHPPGPRPRNRYRLNHQIPVMTTQTSHQTTHPANHLNQLCRPPTNALEVMNRSALGVSTHLIETL